MDLQRALGLQECGPRAAGEPPPVVQYLSVKLAALGYWHAELSTGTELLPIARDLLANFQERGRLLADHLCPADARIQAFLDAHLADLGLPETPRLPSLTLVLDRHGLARELSLPLGRDEVHGSLLSSYRLGNGVLHNPVRDRRTTVGVFHVAEGGLPIPADKLAVPKGVFARMLKEALHPSAELLRLPFTSQLSPPAEVMASLLLRPRVVPAVPGVSAAKSMEVRLLAPGALVSNLDFVESIFGNAGDPMLPENDAGLDVEHWTGHTGCVVLAPQLCGLRKKELGLPRWEDATDAQRRQGTCWKREDELYNNGQPFKLTCRTAEGVIVTLLADNYFGYCKKEIKTQVSYAANLYGLAEEEHSGGALAFPSYQLGDTFRGDVAEAVQSGHTLDNALRSLGERAERRPEGYAVDRAHGDIIYVPEDVCIDLWAQRVSWEQAGTPRTIPLLAGKVYVLPNGYKVRMARHPQSPTWSLAGTLGEGMFCHKPSTVSGGGKSEISKSIGDAVLFGPVYIGDVKADLDRVAAIFARDYSDRVREDVRPRYSAERLERPLLDPARSLGSVIKMLTPSAEEFTDAYNAWLRTIPDEIRALVFIIKRMYKPEWGGAWREHFGVDIINGAPGHEFKFGTRKLVGSYLRVGFMPDGSWRTFKLRQDFRAADKVQVEDDITASIVVPAESLHTPLGPLAGSSVKLVDNCEFRLFQRPDDAIHRGYDKQTEHDMAQAGLFCSNFEPLTPQQAQERLADAIAFAQYTPAMQEHLARGARQRSGYVVSSAHPRLVGGKPSKNPRYLQVRPDLETPRDRYLAEVGTRLKRQVPADREVVFTVDAVLPGRRNNPAEPQVRSLAVYNPIHYQQLPELFMDLVCSLTGKSPSTTGAGSEGALTKGPFNALRATADLNNALVSMILTGHAGFTTTAGYCGPLFRVDHDISLLIPEIWSRLSAEEREPAYLVREGLLEKVEDFTHGGTRVLASRLGYRITAKFVHAFLGRIFDSPLAVFTPEMLQPERQDLEAFVDGVNNIVEAQQRVAQGYFEDGSIEDACPPLRILLHLMTHGHFEGKGVDHPEVRAAFQRDALLESDWYQERLLVHQHKQIALWRRHVEYLKHFLARKSHADEATRLRIRDRLERAEQRLHQVASLAFFKSLKGTLGANPDTEMARPAAAGPGRSARTLEPA